MNSNAIDAKRRRGCLRRWMVFLLLGAALVSGNCSVRQTMERTRHKVARTLTLGGSHLKKKVGLFDFQNRSLRESRDFQKVFHKGLPAYLEKECTDIIVSAPGGAAGLAVLGEPPRLASGEVDNYALAVVGRRLGLNAIVVGSLEDIRVMDELRGILWAKDTQHLIQVYIRVQVFDDATATKIMDRTFERRIQIDELEYNLISSSRSIKLPELNETLHNLLVDIGDNICWSIESLPWVGFLTRIDGQRYIISSGSGVGLKVGDILQVFDSSKTIKGVGGQRFFLPGPKIGEIKIVAVSENSAQAERLSGENIKAGSTVRKK